MDRMQQADLVAQSRPVRPEAVCETRARLAIGEVLESAADPDAPDAMERLLDALARAVGAEGAAVVAGGDGPTRPVWRADTGGAEAAERLDALIHRVLARGSALPAARDAEALVAIGRDHRAFVAAVGARGWDAALAERVAAALAWPLLARIDREAHEDSAGAAVRLAQARFEALASLTANTVFETDVEGRFTYLEGPLPRLAGTDGVQFVGRTRREAVADWTTEADAPMLAALEGAHAARRPFAAMPYRISRGPRGEQWFEVSAAPRYDGAGVFAGFRGVSTEATGARIGTEAARLRAAVEAAPVGLILCDDNDRVVFANARYHEFYPECADVLRPGVSFEDLCRVCVSRVQQQGGESTEAWIAERLRRHREPGAAMECETESGRAILVIEARTADGGYLGAHVDVSPMALARERAILEAQRNRAAIDAKSRFLADISHELRTPLTAIVGFADLIAMGARGPIDPRYVEDAGMIRQSARFLLSLIVDILDMSKIEAGRMSVARSSVDAASAVREAVTMLALQARKKGVALTVTAPDDLPPVWAERRRLVQIVQNLVSNAVKFTDAGGVRVTLEVADRALRLKVADDGRGMTPEQIELAMTPFTQIDVEADAVQGTGLGLPLVKAMVALHDGDLDISSAPGAGTVVIVSLPLAAAD